jgi:hypothetical protein
MIPTAANGIAHRGLTKSISQAVEEDVAAAAAFDVLLSGWRAVVFVLLTSGL